MESYPGLGERVLKIRWMINRTCTIVVPPIWISLYNSDFFKNIYGNSLVRRQIKNGSQIREICRRICSMFPSYYKKNLGEFLGFRVTIFKLSLFANWEKCYLATFLG